MTLKSEHLVFIAVGIIIISIFGLLLLKPTNEPDKTINELLFENYDKKETPTNYIYNSFSFVKVDGTWYTQAQRGDTAYNLLFNFGPKETENITIKGIPNKEFLNKGFVYLTFDPNSPQEELAFMAIATSDLAVGLSRAANIRTIPACTKEHESCTEEGAVIIDCDAGEPTIKLNVSNQTSLVWQDNCVTISGSQKDIDRAATRFLYKLLGIMS